MTRLLSRPLSVLLAGAAGAAGAYLWDPRDGARRRAVARDRLRAAVRRQASQAGDAAQTTTHRAADSAKGAAATVKRAAEPEREAANDQALADRVRSEALRDADLPKSINVNAEAGIVYLRGEVKRPEQIKALVAAAKQVDGVRGVESLLHLPGTPAQTKQETEEETRLRVNGD